MDVPLETPEGVSPANAFILAQGGPCWTSDLPNCKSISFHCSNPPRLRSWVIAARGRSHHRNDSDSGLRFVRKSAVLTIASWRQLCRTHPPNIKLDSSCFSASPVCWDPVLTQGVYAARWMEWASGQGQSAAVRWAPATSRFQEVDAVPS